MAVKARQRTVQAQAVSEAYKQLGGTPFAQALITAYLAGVIEGAQRGTQALQDIAALERLRREFTEDSRRVKPVEALKPYPGLRRIAENDSATLDLSEECLKRMHHGKSSSPVRQNRKHTRRSTNPTLTQMLIIISLIGGGMVSFVFIFSIIATRHISIPLSTGPLFLVLGALIWFFQGKWTKFKMVMAGFIILSVFGIIRYGAALFIARSLKWGLIEAMVLLVAVAYISFKEQSIKGDVKRIIAGIKTKKAREEVARAKEEATRARQEAKKQELLSELESVLCSEDVTNRFLNSEFEEVRERAQELENQFKTQENSMREDLEHIFCSKDVPRDLLRSENRLIRQMVQAGIVELEAEEKEAHRILKGILCSEDVPQDLLNSRNRIIKSEAEKRRDKLIAEEKQAEEILRGCSSKVDIPRELRKSKNRIIIVMVAATESEIQDEQDRREIALREQQGVLLREAERLSTMAIAYNPEFTHAELIRRIRAAINDGRYHQALSMLGVLRRLAPMLEVSKALTTDALAGIAEQDSIREREEQRQLEVYREQAEALVVFLRRQRVAAVNAILVNLRDAIEETPAARALAAVNNWRLALIQARESMQERRKAYSKTENQLIVLLAEGRVSEARAMINEARDYLDESQVVRLEQRLSLYTERIREEFGGEREFAAPQAEQAIASAGERPGPAEGREEEGQPVAPLKEESARSEQPEAQAARDMDSDVSAQEITEAYNQAWQQLVDTAAQCRLRDVSFDAQAFGEAKDGFELVAMYNPSYEHAQALSKFLGLFLGVIAESQSYCGQPDATEEGIKEIFSRVDVQIISALPKELGYAKRHLMIILQKVKGECIVVFRQSRGNQSPRSPPASSPSSAKVLWRNQDVVTHYVCSSSPIIRKSFRPDQEIVSDKKKKVVIFGAGSIGRGFFGQLFYEAGYEIVFVDVVPPLIDALNHGSYAVHIVDNLLEDIRVTGVSAIHSQECERVAKETAAADLAGIALFRGEALNAAAAHLARAMRIRKEHSEDVPFNVIISINEVGISLEVRALIYAHLSLEEQAYCDQKLGLVESVISRMAPLVTGEQRDREPSGIWSEAYKILPVDRGGFKGDIPQIPGLRVVDDLKAYEYMKIYIHNAMHAITAYIGYLKGLTYIYEAIRDPQVYALVRDAGLSSKDSLLKMFPVLRPQEAQEYVEDLLGRFDNEPLEDTITRVGRDVLRKLKPQDRLVKPARLCQEYGLDAGNFALGIAAALLFDYAQDNEAPQLISMLADSGPQEVLRQVCGINPGEPLAGMILADLIEAILMSDIVINPSLLSLDDTPDLFLEKSIEAQLATGQQSFNCQ